MKDAMKKKRKDLAERLKVLKEFQARLGEDNDSPPTKDEAEAMDVKVEEANALQVEIKAYDDRMRGINAALAAGAEIGDPILPNDHQPGETDKQVAATPAIQTKWGALGLEQKAADGKPVVAYMRLGHYVATRKALHDFVAQGSPKAQVVLANIPRILTLRGEREPVVPVSLEMIKAADELKAVPTLGDGIIEPTLDPDLVRVTEHDRLVLRDVLDIQQTNSDAVKYTRIVSYTRAAASVARSAQKPETGMVMDAVTEPVQTIAVWMPVEEQQLSDYPALSGLINGELLYDVDKHVEELCLYGDGTGTDWTGILNDPAVLDARVVVDDTLIDIARRGITDVRRAGYEPNAILVDPLDWEDIVLAKGTDNRYVWVVVTEGATQRLWAVPVIETVAMEDFQGNATEARNMLIGDFARGATLWDRMQSQISVGWINDQFIRNQRTILAEMRAAFGVKRPGAFRKHETQAASSS